MQAMLSIQLLAAIQYPTIEVHCATRLSDSTSASPLYANYGQTKLPKITYVFHW